MRDLLDILLGRKKIKIKAVHEEDLEDILEKYRLLEKIHNEELTCSICSRVITLQNIGKICPREDHVNLRCDQSWCMMGLSSIPQPPDRPGSGESEEDEIEVSGLQ